MKSCQGLGMRLYQDQACTGVKRTLDYTFGMPCMHGIVTTSYYSQY